jgi:hypothetical protein
MLKIIKNTRISSLVFGSAALIALISATPAAAQGVPAGLLRLDSSQAYYARQAYAQRLIDAQRLTAAQQAEARSAYARMRRNNAQ